MERTARLVRIALASLPPAPGPWVHGAADVAAALGRSGGRSGHEGADAVGVAGGGSGREPAHAVRQAGGSSGREGVLAVVRKEEGGNKVNPVVGEGYPHKSATDDPEGGYEARVGSKAEECTGSQGANQVFAVDEEYTHHRTTDDLKGGRGERVGSKAQDVVGSHAAGPGRSLFSAASHLTVPRPAPYSSASDSSPSGKVCSTVPLVFHDKILVSSKKMREHDLDSIAVLDEDWTTRIDISDSITSILREHTGTVSRFRIDSSKWSNSKCLENWIDLISEKSVEELELLNLGHKPSSIFPIENLQSKNLRKLCIGFLRLANLDLYCFRYTSLQILDLFCCEFENIKLSWIVNDCASLKELRVQYCFVDLKVNSSSLEVLYFLGNTGPRIIVESAPSLSYLVTGILPKQQYTRQRIQASVSINSVPLLKSIKHIMLPYHKITVNSVDITKDVALLPFVQELKLFLEMSNPTQLHHLRKLLESFPKLQDLCVERMDSIGRDEGFDIMIDQPFDDIDVVDSVKNSLTSFSLLHFQGGPSERHLIQCLLKSAPNLTRMSTSRSVSCSKRLVREAVNQIRTYDRVSDSCTLTFE